jgi:hypothetical protein
MPTSQVQGQNLHEDGESGEKSARIADASRSEVAQRDLSYEHWSKEELTARAREIGLQGRTLMTKAQLVKALRSR